MYTALEFSGWIFWCVVFVCTWRVTPPACSLSLSLSRLLSLSFSPSPSPSLPHPLSLSLSLDFPMMQSGRVVAALGDVEDVAVIVVAVITVGY
jgi:hypothetical protein